MEHPLDSPAWNALVSGNKNIANGTASAKYFDKSVSPFLGVAEPSPGNFKELFDVVPFSGYFAFITPVELVVPEPWHVVREIRVHQMVFEKQAREIKADAEILPLSDKHIPQMLELTKLTNPGPFAERTIDFGHYRGIFDGERLVAMAGQRMNPAPYAEISAVCTHPDALGKGYAAQLLLNQAERIKAAGQVPFLHVLTGNERAIALYHSLGFVTRKEMVIYTLQK